MKLFYDTGSSGHLPLIVAVARDHVYAGIPTGFYMGYSPDGRALGLGHDVPLWGGPYWHRGRRCRMRVRRRSLPRLIRGPLFPLIGDAEEFRHPPIAILWCKRGSEAS